MTLQTDPQYKLRLPPELKEKIVASSKAHNRSMNADIVARLEQTFSDFDDASFQLRLKEAVEHQKKMDSMLAEIMQEIQALKKPTA